MPDLLVEPGRLGGRFDVQFLGQHAPAGFIVGQGLGAAAAEGQQAHHLLLGHFVPRFQVQLSPGVGQRLLVFAALFVASGQPPQGIQHQATEMLPPEDPPLLKGRAVCQRDILQKRSPVKLDRIFELPYCLGVRGWAARLLGWQQCGEGGDVDPGIARVVELDRMPGGEKKGRVGCVVPNHPAEAGQGVAQVGPRSPFGPVGPEHLGQGLAAVRPVRLGGQIGQQRPGLFAFKVGDRFAIQGDLNRPQETDREMGHCDLQPLRSGNSRARTSLDQGLIPRSRRRWPAAP